MHHAVRHSSTPLTNETLCTFEIEADHGLVLEQQPALQDRKNVPCPGYLKVYRLRFENLTLIFGFRHFRDIRMLIVAIDWDYTSIG